MENTEVWKDVVGYEGLYQVSNLGQIKSLEKKRWTVRNDCYSTYKEKKLKTIIRHNRYLRVILCKGEIYKTKLVHQLVAMAFLNHTPCGHKLVVNHKNFIRTDNRVENLEIVTQRENANQKHIKSSSKFTGVYWNKRYKKWYSSICVEGKPKRLGQFNIEEEAYQYYENALISIKNNTEIIIKKPNFTSKHKGISWSIKTGKWRAYVTINKNFKHLGYFNTETEAVNAYQKESELHITL